MKWEVIEECDDGSGVPACVVTDLHESYMDYYGFWIWITKTNKGFEVQVFPYSIMFKTLKVCKSLASAKRWVASNFKE